MTTRRPVIAIAAMVLLAGCSGGSHRDDSTRAAGAGGGPRGAWTGEVTGTDAFVAVVADGEQLIAYVCDNGKTSEWFAGNAAGSDLGLVARDGAQLDLSLDSNASGRVRLHDGTVHAFRLTSTPAPSLYRAEAGGREARALAGWIKRSDGSVRGSVQLTTPTGTTVTSAPALSAPTLPVPTINVTLPLAP